MGAGKVVPLRETELFAPIREYLVRHGYTVRAEVEHCDIAAVKGEDLIIIELKRRMGLNLLLQAVDRQRATESVYVALPGPVTLERGSRWRGILHLLKRLELGLITVTFGKGAPQVAVISHPLPGQRRKLKRRRRAVLSEVAGRSGNHNQGGSCGCRLITAYREAALRIACALERWGPQAPRELRARGTGEKTQPILARNYYGWFTRIDHGVYALTAAGGAALEDFPELSTRIRAELAGGEDPAASGR